MKISPAARVSRSMRLVYVACALVVTIGGAHAGKPAKSAKPGSVTGTIRFAGAPKPPTPAKITDPTCKGAREQHDVITGSGGGLAETVVVLEGKAAPKKPPAEPVVIVQDGCMYSPRVAVATRGQAIEIRNGDPTLHNVHAYLDGSTEFNLAQPRTAKPIRREVAESGVLELKCDVHRWMHAWVVTADSALVTVTGADGRFSLTGVPPGEYTLNAWHPSLGEKTTKVVVAAGKPATASLSF